MMKKTLLILLVLLLSCSLVLLLLLPTLLSTSWVKNRAISFLEKKYEARISIGNLHLSWFGHQWINNLSVERKDVKAFIDLADFDTSFLSLLKNRNHPQKLLFSGAIELQNGSIAIGDKISLNNLLIKTDAEKKLTMTGQTKQQNETGEFSLLGELNFPSNWTLHISRFPSVIIENFFKKYPLSQILGPTFNADVKLHFQNSLDEFSYEKTLQSQNLSLKSSGVYKKGVVELSTPLDAAFILTESLSDILFKDASFQPISAQSIHVLISPQNTSIPIRPFSWKKLSLPCLTVDLQKIICRNYGTLSDFLSVIQLFPRLNQHVEIWFQSAPMSIQNGICTIERTEMLIDRRYEIGAWGSLNLANRTAQMVLGITSSALYQALDLHNLPPDYTIPMRLDGPFKDLHLHTSRALKVIGTLLLIEKQPFLPIPGGVFLPEVKPSPPVRKPLPW